MSELKPGIRDEGNSLDCILVENYYIPAIEFSEDECHPIEKRGRRQKTHPEETKLILLNHLIFTGKL